MPVLTSLLPAPMLPSARAELAFGIRRGHSLAVVHGTHRALQLQSLAGRALVRPPVFSERCLAMRCPGSGAFWSLVRLASWTIAPVLPRISARQPEPIAGGKSALAFGACSQRTSGSPRLLLLSSRS